jgi:hypothetical protein
MGADAKTAPTSARFSPRINIALPYSLLLLAVALVPQGMSFAKPLEDIGLPCKEALCLSDTIAELRKVQRHEAKPSLFVKSRHKAPETCSHAQGNVLRTAPCLTDTSFASEGSAKASKPHADCDGTDALVLTSNIGSWEVIDDALWARSASWIDNPYPDPELPFLKQALVLLSIQCDQGKPTVFINHNFEVDADAVEVRYQIDGSEVHMEHWAADTSISNVPPDPVRFVRALLGRNTLRITFIWPGARGTSTVFQIAGLETAIKPMRKHCAW